jgi:hypothetical protein
VNTEPAQTSAATAAAMLRTALTRKGVTFQEIDGPHGAESLRITLDPQDPARGMLEISDRDWSLNHPTHAHTGWSIFRRAEDGEYGAEPVYIAGDGAAIVSSAEDASAAAAFVTEYISAANRFEQCRAVLRATIKTRQEAPNYTVILKVKVAMGNVSVTNESAITMPWGQAMACAQKSLHNGAEISPGHDGAFTLTGPESDRTARFQPA